MKRISIIALTGLLLAAMTLPASAVENIFGGYWRTRAFTQQQFSGDNRNEEGDLSRVDTRTRLYYTAKINDKLAFHNKFEFDAVWGDDELGDIGADGQVFEIKHSYADWDMGPVTLKVGIQGYFLNRGFTSDTDGSGAKVIWTIREGLYLPASWIRFDEGYDNEDPTVPAKDLNKGDLDGYVASPLIFLSPTIKINPTYAFLHSREAREVELPGLPAGALSNINGHIIGLNVDAGFDFGSIWFSGIYQTGSLKLTKKDPFASALGPLAGKEFDLNGYILAIGGDVNAGPGDVHGQFFYASGDDDPADGDLDQHIALSSASYYWAEIMGLGIFDNQASFGATGDKISNIYAANIGATVKPMDKLSATLDIWYASRAEDIVNSDGDLEDKLGTEIDLKVTYELVDGLNLDVVGAYLFAEDATGNGEDNPIEVGTRLSLSF